MERDNLVGKRFGWTKGLCVCRKKDLGNYSPDNCYIATKSQNAKEVRSRVYEN